MATVVNNLLIEVIEKLKQYVM